jgi:hypothetical protein
MELVTGMGIFYLTQKDDAATARRYFRRARRKYRKLARRLARPRVVRKLGDELARSAREDLAAFAVTLDACERGKP